LISKGFGKDFHRVVKRFPQDLVEIELGNQLNPYQILRKPFNKSIKFLTKSFRNQLGNQLNSLPNPFESILNPDQILWKSIQFLTRSFGNQLKTLSNP